jgi:hypothetical protein
MILNPTAVVEAVFKKSRRFNLFSIKDSFEKESCVETFNSFGTQKLESSNPDPCCAGTETAWRYCNGKIHFCMRNSCFVDYTLESALAN